MVVKNIQSNSTNNYEISDELSKVNKNKDNKDNNQEKKSSANINAKDLNLIGQDNNKLQELFMKKKAWKLQSDQFNKDLKTDENMKSHADKRDALLKEAKEQNSEYKRLEGLKEDLKNSYGISEESQEQQDLVLLEKQMLNKEPLTNEEKERISKIGPLSEYQSAYLEYTSMADVFMKRAEQAVDASVNENNAISAIKQGLLKSSPMIDAKKNADDILQQLDDEIQKTMLEELKRRVNDNLNINTEDQLLPDPKKLKDNKKATEEDVKGLAIDEKI